MKIFVTGSSGFIGFHLIRKLLNAGYDVVGIDDHNDYYNPDLKLERLALLNSKNFTFHKMDINNICIDDENFDLAINLAAQAGVRVSADKEYLYESSNIAGFKAFCNFCREKDINKILYASSSSVYSDDDNEKFSEHETLLKPKSEYGKSKLLNEIYASELIKSNDLSMVGLRFFSVYGPFGRPDMAYYSFSKSIKENKVICLNNKGNMYRDMTFIDDIIQGTLGAIDYLFNPESKNRNEIFNLGNDAPIKTSYLLHKIEKIIGNKALIQHYTTQNENMKTQADITKAKNLLGYNPKVSFDQGIERFLDWHKHYENI
ncbi:NAD-dependent epimerase/dehydratase family protein [Gammaproteobacteria bacterium]|nr:NAD-dependent epimerase/dehydratase family protein [Gammaproteobacteria bacterium]